MATHYARHAPIRRPLDWLIELVCCWLTAWVEFWARAEPADDPAHETGATEVFAADLHDINTDLAALHDQPTGRYQLLMDAAVISGDPDLTEVFPRIAREPTPAQLLGHVVSIDGGRLCGSLTDQLPGA